MGKKRLLDFNRDGEMARYHVIAQDIVTGYLFIVANCVTIEEARKVLLKAVAQDLKECKEKRPKTFKEDIKNDIYVNHRTDVIIKIKRTKLF